MVKLCAVDVMNVSIVLLDDSHFGEQLEHLVVLLWAEHSIQERPLEPDVVATST